MDNKTLKLSNFAVPYYGRLRMAQGLSRLFFIGNSSGHIGADQLQIWCPEQQPSLAAWLADRGVTYLLCAERKITGGELFFSHGIEVATGMVGNPEAVLQQALFDREAGEWQQEGMVWQQAI